MKFHLLEITFLSPAAYQKIPSRKKEFEIFCTAPSAQYLKIVDPQSTCKGHILKIIEPPKICYKTFCKRVKVAKEETNEGQFLKESF